MSRQPWAKPKRMPPKRKERPFVGSPTDPLALSNVAAALVERNRVRNFAHRTVDAHVKCLEYFLEWCQQRAILSAADVTPAIVGSYQHWLYNFRKQDGEPLSFGTQFQRLSVVRMLFAWLARSHLLPYNPASEIELPHVGKRLPKHVLSAEEVDRIISQPDLDSPLGLRDRAMLEVMYSSGMRRFELANLRLYDVDLDRGTVRIREGKFRKDRVLPLGERACYWTQKYVLEVRPFFVADPDEGILFLTHRGEPVSPVFLSREVRRYIEQAGITKPGSCHLFRHAMATLMLENGADIRYIQEMLGHGSLSTTEVYTHVSIRKLKNIHSATHPSAKMQKRAADEDPRWDEPTPRSAPQGGQAAQQSAIQGEEQPEPEPKHWKRRTNHCSPTLNTMRRSGRWSGESADHPVGEDPEPACSSSAAFSSSENEESQ